jgi:hypothetical protein
MIDHESKLLSLSWHAAERMTIAEEPVKARESPDKAGQGGR